MILNWEDDSEIYHDRKTKSEHNGDEEEGLNENSKARGQKVFIPTHLSPVVRTKRFIFVFLFMFIDATLTIYNVSLGGYKIVQIIFITFPDHCGNTFLALDLNNYVFSRYTKVKKNMFHGLLMLLEQPPVFWLDFSF